ncbi:MAG: DUF4097 family beta strand repeat-containing protein [Myxococcales bacterium]
MIRIALVAAFLFSGAAQAKPKHHAPDFEIVIPPIPKLPELPDFEELGMLPEMLAQNDMDDDDDNDRDSDSDSDVIERDEHGVRVYKMNRMPRIPMPRVRIERDDRLDESQATAKARGNRSATLAVKGPVSFQLRAQAGDVDIVTTDRQQVSITLTEASYDDVALLAFGDRIEPSFHGRRQLRHGKLRVELPRGSRLDLATMSGDITAQHLGEVRIRTLSGDIKIAGVNKADVQSISGDVRIDDAAGPVRLHTVSGTAQLSTTGTAPQIEFQSASGSLDWSGACARDCHLNAETVSGELRMAVDSRSSFELSFTSHSGELRDEVNLTVKRAPSRKHGMASGWMEATFGKGEGVIEADAFSGNLVVRKK